MSHVSGRYIVFDRAEWAGLRAATPLTLSETDLDEIRGLNDQVDLEEVTTIYLPVSRLLNLHVAAAYHLHTVSQSFVGSLAPRVPFIIGIAGSVAVGKSTSARLLQALMKRWPDHPRVDLITTDGFLHPNRVLDERGLMHRKGFPESYDVAHLISVLRELKSGVDEVRAPVYSHVVYDIVEGEEIVLRHPDIVIVEGLNVLQIGPLAASAEFVSDYFDFSLYIDADEADIENWYVTRFLRLRDTVFNDPSSFFRHYAHLDEDEAVDTARQIWRDINGRNLRENIEPTRQRARLVLRKGADHRITSVALQRV